jgi:hypothetical protein
MSYYNQFLEIVQNPASYPKGNLFFGHRNTVIDLIAPICGDMRRNNIPHSTDVTYITDNLGTVSVAWFERDRAHLVNFPFDDNM